MGFKVWISFDTHMMIHIMHVLDDELDEMKFRHILYAHRMFSFLWMPAMNGYRNEKIRKHGIVTPAQHGNSENGKKNIRTEFMSTKKSVYA